MAGVVFFGAVWCACAVCELDLWLPDACFVEEDLCVEACDLLLDLAWVDVDGAGVVVVAAAGATVQAANGRANATAASSLRDEVITAGSPRLQGLRCVSDSGEGSARNRLTQLCQ